MSIHVRFSQRSVQDHLFTKAHPKCCGKTYWAFLTPAIVLCASVAFAESAGTRSDTLNFDRGETSIGIRPDPAPKPEPPKPERSNPAIGGRDVNSGSTAPQAARQNAINQINEHINQLMTRRADIVKERLDLLNDHDRDFAVGLGQEWNNKMNELNGQMTLNLNEYAQERGKLRDLQNQH